MGSYIPMKSEFGSLEHGLYKLIEVWMIYWKIANAICCDKMLP